MYNIGDKVIYLQNNCQVTNKPIVCTVLRKYIKGILFKRYVYDLQPNCYATVWKNKEEYGIECLLTDETAKLYNVR
jgi:hypothetical protein